MAGEPVIERLFAATTRERYLQVWEHFCPELSDAELSAVIAQLFDLIVGVERPLSEHPALMACWRQRNRRYARDVLPPETLSSMIQRALTVSLALANSLYYFWTSVRSGPYTELDRAVVRRRMVEDARQAYVDNSERLVIALRPDSPSDASAWTLRQLITPADQDEAPSELTDFVAWRWLGGVLLDAATRAPALVVPQIALAIGDIETRTGSGRRSQSYSLDLAKVEALFGGPTRELVAAFANSALVSPETPWFVSDARSQLAADA